ncbi:hypothetical protein Taro_007535 [Colocasia esculenta]|uniref:Uncharacterized protein n=1 Tax=Colocasia esculenta TaxID=4460 RepID=A0A843TUB8_COLES|nr:hypothetical protein [Colocasia esculenta]
MYLLPRAGRLQNLLADGTPTLIVSSSRGSRAARTARSRDRRKNHHQGRHNILPCAGQSILCSV